METKSMFTTSKLDRRATDHHEVYITIKITHLTERVFLLDRFALFEATFCVGLHCRVDDLMLPFPLPRPAFCTYTTMHHIE